MADPTRDVNILGSGNTDLEDYARAAALLQGREVAPEPTPEQGLYFRSDDFSFAKAGVPALYASAGSTTRRAGPRGAARSSMISWRIAITSRATNIPRIGMCAERSRTSRSTTTSACGSAHSRRFPRWYPNSEFRAGKTAP